VLLKAAPGTGIVSSVVLESDDLDEIDLEWIGGNSGEVQTNYFGKGNTTSYDRAIWETVNDAQTTSHNYTVNWQSDKTEWYIDGSLVRTLNYADAVGGSNYPQTPMRLKIGIWAGGDTSLNSEGTVTWAGGATDYSQGPFSMSLQKVEITNQNPASSYSYGDQTGSYTSIKVVDSDSTSSVSSGGSAKSSTNSTSTASGTSATSLAMTSGENSTASAASSSAAAVVSTAAAACGVERSSGLAVLVVVAITTMISFG
jgi:hypothetical protein